MMRILLYMYTFCHYHDVVLNLRHNLPATMEFVIVKLSFLPPFSLLRFKRTWRLLMSFHYWLLLWWRRLRLLFKPSQSALIRIDEFIEGFPYATQCAFNGRASWSQFIGVQIHVKVDCCCGCDSLLSSPFLLLIYTLVLIMPFCSWVRVFHIDFRSNIYFKD